MVVVKEAVWNSVCVCVGERKWKKGVCGEWRYSHIYLVVWFEWHDME